MCLGRQQAERQKGTSALLYGRVCEAGWQGRKDCSFCGTARYCCCILELRMEMGRSVQDKGGWQPHRMCCVSVYTPMCVRESLSALGCAVWPSLSEAQAARDEIWKNAREECVDPTLNRSGDVMTWFQGTNTTM